jgi:hypothetical protein
MALVHLATRQKDPPVHSAAEIFPLISEGSADWNELERSMREHGFDASFPVLLWEGKVIDGRNRLRVARKLGIEPAFENARTEDVGASPAEFVRRANLARRQMTPVQLAAAAVALETEYAREAAARIVERGKAGGKIGGKIGGKNHPKSEGGNAPSPPSEKKRDESQRSAVQAAQAVGAGIGSTKQLKTVRDKAPEVFALVKDGVVGKVSEAVALAKAPADVRAEAVERIVAGEKPSEVLREIPKPERTPRAVKWDADERIIDLNSYLGRLVDECPARDRTEVIATLEKWTRKMRERT